ncbi:MAG: hypothetical protein ACP5QR_05055 [Rhizomicrobium sp.]
MTNSADFRHAPIRAGLGDPRGEQPSDSPCVSDTRDGVSHLYHDAPIIPDWYHQYGNGPEPRDYADFDREPLTLRERALLIGGLCASLAIVSGAVAVLIFVVFK